MFDFTTETILNDLTRVSVVDDSTTLAAPASPGATAVAGGNLTAGTYYYKVTAINAQGETVGSTEASATTASANLAVTVTWTAVTGATGYRVYRGTSTGAQNKYFSVSGQSTATFTDTVLAAGTADTVPTTNTAYVNTDGGVPSGDKALVIQRLNKYLKSNTGKVYKRAGTTAVNEVTTITVTGTATGVYRLALDVTMSGSYPIDYDRWAINKGKPFYVEFAITSAPADATALATALAAGFNKGLKKYNGQNIKDIVVTSSGANIVVTAQNEYQRFKGAFIGILNAGGDTFVTLATGTVTTTGAEGFGTAWYITKNLRIPTQESTRFYGENQDELPISGSLYNQYTFQYNAARNFTGQGAVGQTIQSKTTHVIFVPSTLAATFEGYILSAFGTESMLDAQTNFPIN